ncbi:MAG TPA: SUMF1/EgtB/PvdO family nonheme iron enzyme [Pirellulales bacterium]|jgi:formylglycine-generating enzyme required for sulfatase activity|nr:SUMF1/EgtB/PvdO family nonheme iron enzyme [Pirellulales bacterium]
MASGENRAWPVATLKPNDFGLFDMLGNAFEWCDDPFETYPKVAGKVSEDSGTTQPVVDGGRRVLRGGALDVLPGLVRSVCRDFCTHHSFFTHSASGPQ